MKKTQNEEFDLFLFFKTLYASKWIISIFVVLTLILGTGYYLNKKPIYKSEMIFLIDNIPPFYEAEKVFTDLEKIFYSATIFRDWKKNNTSTLIKFEDFSKTKIVEKTIVQQNPLKITFEIKNKNKIILHIKSKELKYLDDVYNYAKYMNNLLKSSYKLEAVNALSIIEKNIDILSKLGKGKVDYMTIKLFLMKIQNGAQPFVIGRPTIPIKVSPKLSLILIFSLLLGGILGCLYVIFREDIHNSKN